MQPSHWQLRWSSKGGQQMQPDWLPPAKWIAQSLPILTRHGGQHGCLPLLNAGTEVFGRLQFSMLCYGQILCIPQSPCRYQPVDSGRPQPTGRCSPDPIVRQQIH
jgi:hypothetical protein